MLNKIGKKLIRDAKFEEAVLNMKEGCSKAVFFIKKNMFVSGQYTSFNLVVPTGDKKFNFKENRFL